MHLALPQRFQAYKSTNASERSISCEGVQVWAADLMDGATSTQIHWSDQFVSSPKFLTLHWGPFVR